MDVLFYHLERQPLEAVLPVLLEKTLERGWRALVRAGSPERVQALDRHLWTYRDDSFLPHGTLSDRHVSDQPVLLTSEPGDPIGANVLFLVDGAPIDGFEVYERAVLLFDGRDDAALKAARAAWRTVRDAGHAATYWQQSPEGRWEKKGG